MKSVLLTIVFFLGSLSPNPHEEVTKYRTAAAHSTLTLEGTSTLHDWEMVAENFSGELHVELQGEGLKIEGLELVVPVKALKSGKNVMDNNAYKALKYEQHPDIEYKLIAVNECELASEGCYTMNSIGSLTIAGVCKRIEIPLTAFVSENNISFQGTTQLLMTSYGVEPPSFLMGAMSTGDLLTIKFSIQYLKKS